ncbi:sigma-70 RNA polymerase sigma factor region 4 domain-containing protein [Mastigocoleus testarum]|uniref:RNA polymerase sigma-70 region 2 domain-containing protein n=1 Tax=Mastigocoleus testarum BC008 TaxID=371196 RepID=A0A0V7ZBT9_9CYAN|nr:sigma-70 family RNA polymerase sigma factor [Mastigocoleus testarum]KST61963.1 hypothetical protein BC008_07975 [Mastigocoleus testarum BC008]
MTKNNNFPEVDEVLQAKWLKIHIMNRIHVLKLNSFLSEEDVIQHVGMCLIEKLRSGVKIHHPVAWAKLVSERHINALYKRHKMSQTTESDKVEYLANLYYQKNNLYDDYEEITKYIQQLKFASREIIVMRFFQGLSWHKVAEILSHREGKRICAATARKRGERAINKLRQIYLKQVC